MVAPSEFIICDALRTSAVELASIGVPVGLELALLGSLLLLKFAARAAQLTRCLRCAFAWSGERWVLLLESSVLAIGFSVSADWKCLRSAHAVDTRSLTDVGRSIVAASCTEARSNINDDAFKFPSGDEFESEQTVTPAPLCARVITSAISK